MINTRLTSLVRKEFLQILRDPRTLALALVMPLMQLFLLGYAATNDVRNVRMAVFNCCASTAASGSSIIWITPCFLGQFHCLPLTRAHPAAAQDLSSFAVKYALQIYRLGVPASPLLFA